LASAFELLLFDEEITAVKQLPESGRWLIERDDAVPLGLRVHLSSKKEPGELYLARLRWPDYFKAPSLKFLNRDTGAESDPTAGPQVRGVRPQSLDACVSWTLEGHLAHPEWAASTATAFPQREAPVQFALLTLQQEMDVFYERRWRG
jgi:hypothetical protein